MKTSVKILACDPSNRQAALYLNVPYSILMSVSPAFLTAGSLESLTLSEPLDIWIPDIKNNDIKDPVSKIANIETLIAEKLRSSVMPALIAYKEIAQIIRDPAQIASMLPSGIYVNLTYKMHIDRFAHVMADIWNPEDGSPEAEFKWNLAQALAQILSSQA